MKTLSTEEIYSGFQQLRYEQQAIIQKIHEVQMDLNEHQIVLDTLKDLDGDRKCFRLIGGVLCEKTVKDVVPKLAKNKEQLSALVVALNNQLTKKGEELNDFKEKNNIKIRGQDAFQSNSEDGEQKSGGSQPRNVLVNPI
ncbi:unnamed protein product [Nesidiocoris tenuis]|uniref:Prefoldin subunit 2 n=1 Tax=Nesidiocoris tenuis TaxID=355587 RepID=A0A6H5H0T0_9HEMI|nr:unnamed protein product [Nesidiocoris tenuis]